MEVNAENMSGWTSVPSGPPSSNGRNGEGVGDGDSSLLHPAEGDELKMAYQEDGVNTFLDIVKVFGVRIEDPNLKRLGEELRTACEGKDLLQVIGGTLHLAVLYPAEIIKIWSSSLNKTQAEGDESLKKAARQRRSKKRRRDDSADEMEDANEGVDENVSQESSDNQLLKRPSESERDGVQKNIGRQKRREKGRLDESTNPDNIDSDTSEKNASPKSSGTNQKYDDDDELSTCSDLAVLLPKTLQQKGKCVFMVEEEGFARVVTEDIEFSEEEIQIQPEVEIDPDITSESFEDFHHFPTEEDFENLERILKKCHEAEGENKHCPGKQNSLPEDSFPDILDFEILESHSEPEGVENENDSTEKNDSQNGKIELNESPNTNETRRNPDNIDTDSDTREENELPKANETKSNPEHDDGADKLPARSDSAVLFSMTNQRQEEDGFELEEEELYSSVLPKELETDPDYQPGSGEDSSKDSDSAPNIEDLEILPPPDVENQDSSSAKESSKTTAEIQRSKPTCGFCGKTFPYESKLKRHLMIHTEERPFPCSHPGCGQKFREKSKMTLHLLIHKGERPFKCDFPGCSRAFNQPHSLKRHKLTHTKEKSFKCHCGKGFNDPSNMNRHRKTCPNGNGK